MEHSIQPVRNDRLGSGGAPFQLLAKALCQYDRQTLIGRPTRLGTSSSEAEYRENLTACTPDVRALYADCERAHPEFGLTAEDFREAVVTAVDKYLIRFAKSGGAPSAQEIRQFIGELQNSDLYLALACQRGNEQAWQQFDQQ